MFILLSVLTEQLQITSPFSGLIRNSQTYFTHNITGKAHNYHSLYVLVVSAIHQLSNSVSYQDSQLAQLSFSLTKLS